jgi:DNA-binding PadR family transcriptional regulator
MTITSFNGTLSTTTFYILLALADRPLHGYAIRKQVITDSSGEVIIPTGSLYPALRRLTYARLLDQIETADHQGILIQRYRITANGHRQLSSEAKRLRRISYHAQLKLGEKIFA